MENLHGNTCFCAFMFEINMKAHKPAHFHVFSASFYPHIIVLLEYLLVQLVCKYVAIVSFPLEFMSKGWTVP